MFCLASMHPLASSYLPDTTSSYESEPVDNDALCVGWLQSLAPGARTAAERRTLSDLRLQEPRLGAHVPARARARGHAARGARCRAVAAQGEADADGVGLFQGFEESERRTWGVLSEVRFCFSSVCRTVAKKGMQN